MMNENDPLEQRLRRQPLRQIPADWRADILQAARAAQSASQKTSSQANEKSDWFSIIRRELKTLLWPNSKAWAGLAAVWIFIAVIHFSMRDTTTLAVENPAPPSPTMMAELKQQRLMFAELVGSTTPSESDRPRKFPLKPRSERGDIRAV
jgi:hypothetical protein